MSTLRALIVVTNTEGALLVEAVGPEAAKLEADLRDAGVTDQEPSTEPNLSEDIEDGVAHDLGINADAASPVGETPDAVV